MLDNVTNGWQKSDLVILAGRPGMGKTSAVVSMAIHPAVFQDIPVAIFSLEMSSEQLVSRMQSSFSEVNVSKIVKKQLTEDEIIQIERKTENLRDAPIYIDDTPNISILELKGKVRKLVKENNVQLVVIDYLQLMRSGLKTQSRELEISEISRGLKSLAKELSIPVIALSQLSRSVEQRGGDKKPLLSDLRESGAIEQDADMVLFCYRPEYYEIENYEVGNQSFETKGLFMLLISKHRNGELGEIPLRFIHEQTKIVNYTENSSTFVQPNISNNEIQAFSNLKPNEQFSQMENITNNNDEDELLPF
jgi:replicative DNA helicase